MEKKVVNHRVSKFDVQKLLDRIAGGADSTLTIEQLQKNRKVIMRAVQGMRNCYENDETPKDYPTRVYYASCWQEIDAACKNDEKLLEALEGVRISIKWD